MMRRTPLRAKPKPRPQRPDRSAEFASWTPMRRTGVYAMSGDPRPAPKPREPVRDEGYRRLVAALPCSICGIQGASQAAHGNTAKGMGLKACDLTCFPMCHEGANGHHARWDAYAWGREWQRKAEPELAAAAQRLLIERAKTDPKARRVLERVGLLQPEKETEWTE